MSITSEQELEALMREFPDWKEQYPTIYRDVNPPRMHKSRKPNEAKNEIVVQKRKTAVGFTDYQATYRPNKEPRPRSTKRPPQSPRDPNPPPMTFATNQRADFVPQDLSTRIGIVKKDEKYNPPEARFDAKSSYDQEFAPKYPLPDLKRVKAPADKSRLMNSSAKLDGRTITKEHYKKWQPADRFTFTELPCFTGSVLYPGDKEAVQSTTLETYRGRPGPKADMVQVGAGNLYPEGAMDMETVNHQTYRSFDGAKPAQIISQRPEIVLQKKTKFADETQFKRDFPGFRVVGQPRPPLPAQPPPATISLKFDKSSNFETEQRKQFKGVDAVAHPVPKSCKQDTDTYVAPSVQFETLTNQKIDYKPLSLSDAYQSKANMPQSRLKGSDAKFDGETMNNVFFKKWEVTPRKVYGDFHESNSYIPPMSKFDTVSTTQDTYVTKSGSIPPSFKPEAKPIQSLGKHDFNSVTSLAYKDPAMAPRLSKEHASFLLKELRKRKKKKVPTATLR